MSLFEILLGSAARQKRIFDIPESSGLRITYHMDIILNSGDDYKNCSTRCLGRCLHIQIIFNSSYI